VRSFFKQFAVGLSLALCSTSTYAAPAKNEVTGWVTPDEAYSLSVKNTKDGRIGVKMECRGDSRSSSVRESMEIRLTFAPNPSRKRWRWSWGADFVPKKNFYEKHGWTQVSASSFIRPKTGLLVPCGLFHKERG